MSCNCYSKSIVTNEQIPNNRSLVNPGTLAKEAGVVVDILDFLTTSYINILKIIESQYGRNMADKTYEYIPSDYEEYTLLISNIKTIQTKTTNSTLTLLLKIAEETLIGAVNSYALYGDNIILTVDKANLEKRVDDILSDKNTGVIENTFSYSNMSVTKTFTLAAVFNYYIMIYGLPEQSVGFDPVKISFLSNILTQRGIDPYS